MTTLPENIVTDANDDRLFRALAACHAASLPALPDRLVSLIAAAHRLHALSFEIGGAHRTAESRNRLREIVDGLKAAAVEGRPVTVEDAAGLAEQAAIVADLRTRLETSSTAAREAANEATAACRPVILGSLLAEADARILDAAAEPAAVMARVRGFDWSDPAALHRQPKPVQEAFYALADLGAHRDRLLTAVALLAAQHRDWRPDFHGIGTVPGGRLGMTDSGHPALRLTQAVAARDAATIADTDAA